ncbi:hypothetical protein HH219_13005 [Pseudoalteromonas sp. NEC-BIFX-2020_015]|uniref:hypothetical protein n=1 Tax=Pseudoalteromonas sp. NEC-BIFX-2020_015 TaxID=2729544 RepID=UPI0014614961|nr:hypothetical protein [Pseudoalteromonas sp. NEC-BIFX-2020_015]NMR26440.1 hypothetical protein [Pseudoalteromonas sp. NEC-BIFX-2020_015]
MNKKTIFIISGIICLIFLAVNFFSEHKYINDVTVSTPHITPSLPITNISFDSKAPSKNQTVVNSTSKSHMAVNTINSRQSQTPITTPHYIPNITKKTVNAANFEGDILDHQAYLDFHNEQQTRLEQRFVIAAKEKIVKLENLLEKGRQHGLPQTQLQEAIDKIAVLKNMQAKLESKGSN